MDGISNLMFLAPAGLLGLLALAVPLLIHLFSHSKGRKVLIGHIELVRQARRRRVTEIRLTQWLLLALRLVMFTLAAFILAQLVRQGLEQSGLALLPIDLDHVLRVRSLPFHHRDPFDRLLVAQAMSEGCPILSRDTAFDHYDVDRVW